MAETPKVRFLDRSTPPHIATLILLASMSALSMNIFLPSLPAMTTYFDTQYRVMQLSVAVYLTSSAVLQMLVGPLADQMGRRPVLIWGLILFLLATIGCIYAPNATVFLIFRAAQAVVVVAMVLARAIVRDVVSQDKAASMIGYVTMGMSIVPMITPAIGGVLQNTFGWQASFWLCVIVGAAITILVWKDLGETSGKSGLTLGQQFREYPELFRSPRFWGYTLTNALASGAFFAYLGGAPYVGTEVYGMSPATLGLFFGAPAIGYFVGNFLSGTLSVRLGINRMALWGSLFNAGGLVIALVLIGMGFDSPYIFFGLMTLVGLGNGMTLPNATAGALSVRPHLAGTASGLSGSIQIGGGCRAFGTGRRCSDAGVRSGSPVVADAGLGNGRNSCDCLRDLASEAN